MASKFGPGALMAKFDIESCYRNIAVHPLDHHLLGLKWCNSYYMDLALPTLGLRSTLAIFNSVADEVECILVNNYHTDDLLHYLGDFIPAAPANSSICASNLHVAVLVGPASSMVVLGIELDTMVQIARLPTNKFSSIQGILSPIGLPTNAARKRNFSH